MKFFLRLRKQGKAPDSQQVLNLAKLADSRFGNYIFCHFFTFLFKMGNTERNAENLPGECFRKWAQRFPVLSGETCQPSFQLPVGTSLTLYHILIHLCNSLICRVRDDIFSWRVKEEDSAAGKDFVTPQFDEKGRAWVEVEGRRKTSRATVRISKPGTGQVWVNINIADVSLLHSSYTFFRWLLLFTF